MNPYQQTSSDDLKNRWLTAFEQCKNYRDYLINLPIEDDEKIYSYLITKTDIEALLTQDDENLDGIRVYIGHKPFKNAAAVRLIVVATKKDISGNYNDYNIPHKEDKEFKTLLSADRPCPDECSNDNDLNSD